MSDTEPTPDEAPAPAPDTTLTGDGPAVVSATEEFVAALPDGTAAYIVRNDTGQMVATTDPGDRKVLFTAEGALAMSKLGGQA